MFVLPNETAALATRMIVKTQIRNLSASLFKLHIQ